MATPDSQKSAEASSFNPISAEEYLAAHHPEAAPSPSPNGGQRPPTPDELWAGLDTLDLATPPSPLEWQIEQILQKDALTFIYGKPQVGKSFITVGFGGSVATGEPFGGARAVTRPGRVLYIATEGTGGLKRRLWAWAWATAKGDLERFKHLANLLRRNFRIASWGGRGLDVNLGKPESEVNRLLESMSDDLDLVIVDTLNGATPGVDENHVSVAQAFIAAKAHGSFGLTVVHHEGHADNGRMRGSSGLIGAADGIIRATPFAADIPGVLNKGDFIVRLDDACRGGKRKDSEPVGPVAFVVGNPSGLVEHYASLGLEAPAKYASASVLGPWQTTEPLGLADPEVRRAVEALRGLGGEADSPTLAKALELKDTKNLHRSMVPAVEAGLVDVEKRGSGRPSIYRLVEES